MRSLKFINNMIVSSGFYSSPSNNLIYAAQFRESQQIIFINNSIVGGVKMEKTGRDNVFKNNHFFSIGLLKFDFIDHYTTIDYIGENNNFFSAQNAVYFSKVNFGNLIYQNLNFADYTSTISYEINATNYFPFFVNSSSDLHSNSNQLDNIGVFDSLAINDFDFESRFSPNVDIGADEYIHKDSLIDLELTSYPLLNEKCIEKKDVYASLKNIFGDTLNAAFINFQTKDTVGFKIVYDLNLAPNEQIDSIYLFSIYTNSDDSNWVKIWVSDVNGGSDMNHGNDTININFVTNHGINLGNDTLFFCENSTVVVEDSIQFANYLWNDLSNSSSYTVNVEGSYYVTAVDFDGCISSDTLVARYNNFVPEIVSKNDTSICENTSVAIDLSQHQHVTYSALLNGNQFSTDSLLILEQEGEYIFSISSCANVLLDTFNLNVNELIHANLGNAFSICENELMYLQADLDLNSIVWNSGQIQDSILINQTGFYSYNGMDLNNCPIIPDTTFITINQVSVQNLIFNLCQGDSIFHNNRWLSQSGTYHDTLLSSLNCDSIHHITLNLIPNTYKLVEVSACNSYYFADNFLHQSGVYYDTLINQNSCDSIVELHLTISTIDTVIYDNGSMLYSSAGNVLFQWIDCENNTALSWQTLSFFYYPDSSGSYALQVDNAICVDTSVCVIVNTANLVEKNTLQCVISPNPSTGNFTILFSESHENVEMKIFNLLGELMSFDRFENVAQIQVENTLSSGNYILEIKDEYNNTSFYNVSITE